MFEGKHSEVTEKVIGAFFKVYNTLGDGFSEKAVRYLLDEHDAQLLNYLKATILEVGLLLNFGPKAAYRRKVYDNDLKGALTWTNPG